MHADYWSSEAQVLDAGRALAFALDSADPFEVQSAAQELLRVGTTREALPAVAGFRATGPGESADADAEAELQAILSELEIGRTLVAAGAAVDAPSPEGAPVQTLGDALDDLQAGRTDRTSPTTATQAFQAEQTAGSPFEAFRGDLDNCLAQVVDGTKTIATEAVAGLAMVPAAAAQPLLASAVSVVGQIPKVGALAALGLRAIRRAVNALLSLIPDPVRDRLHEIVQTWWDDRGAADVVRRLLGVDDVRERASSVLERQLPDDRWEVAAESLRALNQRHQRSTATIRRVLKVLSTLIGPLAASFVAAAPWLYAAAAAGYGSAVATSFWIGRDSLDVAAGWQRVDGVQVILDRLAA